MSSITKAVLNALTSWETLYTTVAYVRYFKNWLS